MSRPLRLLAPLRVNRTDVGPVAVKAAMPLGGSIALASTVTLQGVDYVVLRARIMP